MAGHTDNSIVINAPMDLVWDMTNDIASWPNLFSEYSEATIISTRENSFLFRLSMHPDANGTVWSWVSERAPDRATRTVRSQRVETGNFKYMWLFWEYLEEVDGVRLRWVQDFELKPGLPMDDAAMRDRLNTNSGIQLQLIKDKVEAAALAATPVS